MLMRTGRWWVKKLDTREQSILRIYVVLAVLILALGVLAGYLWRIQVAHGAEYEARLGRQSIRRVRLPGIRGRIFDRQNVCMAENRLSYCIALYLEELRHSARGRSMTSAVRELIEELAGNLGMKSTLTEEQIRRHIRKRSPLPLLAWKDVGEEVAARLVESGGRYPGVDIYLEPVRVHPQGRVAAHVVGYVGRADQQQGEDEKPWHYYLPEIAGRSGVEKRMDRVVRGHAGGNLVRVDALGFKRNLPGDPKVLVEPQCGSDVKLSLDLRIQRLAEDALAGDPGAVVILDPRNGDVLAMASAPSFDPNMFDAGVSVEELRRMQRDSGRPFLNKAIAGRYPPGSMFKPVVAMSAIESGTPSSTRYQCPGYYDLGSRQLKCWIWQHGGHGLLDMRKALEQSCNVYFCSLAVAIGYDQVYHTAAALGMGKPTGVDLGGENGGNLPTSSSVRFKGDVANLAIGQGALLTTPLQMAVAISAIANGGRVYRPRLVLGVRAYGETQYVVRSPQMVRDVGWSASELSAVRNGMIDVVQSPTGTGKRARVPSLRMAGKTGTAEYGVKEKGKKRVWMTAYAPAANPRYTVVMVVEDGLSGGRTIAPRIRVLMAGIFGIKLEDDTSAAG